jgi:hypothetical protein
MTVAISESLRNAFVALLMLGTVSIENVTRENTISA